MLIFHPRHFLFHFFGILPTGSSCLTATVLLAKKVTFLGVAHKIPIVCHPFFAHIPFRKLMFSLEGSICHSESASRIGGRPRHGVQEGALGGGWGRQWILALLRHLVTGNYWPGRRKKEEEKALIVRSSPIAYKVTQTSGAPARTHGGA